MLHARGAAAAAAAALLWRRPPRQRSLSDGYKERYMCKIMNKSHVQCSYCMDSVTLGVAVAHSHVSRAVDGISDDSAAARGSAGARLHAARDFSISAAQLSSACGLGRG